MGPKLFPTQLHAIFDKLVMSKSYFAEDQNLTKMANWIQCTLRWQQVLLHHVQHKSMRISIHLVCMHSNFTIVACILAYYKCIAGILFLPLCSIFDQKNYLQTWAPSSTHAAYLIFLPSRVCLFHSAWTNFYWIFWYVPMEYRIFRQLVLISE